MSNVVTVSSDSILPNPWQPRRDVGDVSELAKSIERDTLLQLPMGRSVEVETSVANLYDVKYELAFGHRRVAAVKSLGWETVDVIVEELSDDQMVQYALAENRQRVSVEEVEELEAAAKALQEVEGLRQQDVADWMGTSRSNLTHRLKILLLPETYLDKVRGGDMSVRAGLELLALRGTDGHWHEDLLKKLFSNYMWGDLTVENVRHGAARVRPQYWVQIPAKVKGLVTHSMQVTAYGAGTGVFVCDGEIIRGMMEEAEEKRQAFKEEQVQALEPLGDVDEPVARVLLAVLQPNFHDHDTRLLEIMDLKIEALSYQSWPAKYQEWAATATAESLVEVLRWRLGVADG